MFVVNHKKIFVILSALLVLASIVLVFVRGLNIGIDFTGGALLEVSYAENMPDLESVKVLVPEAESIRQVGADGYSIKTRFLTDAEREELIGKLIEQNSSMTVKKFSSVGPVVGQELRNKSILALIILLIATIIYVAISFRKVSKPVSSLWYGLIAIVTLMHDVIIPVGVFALFGLQVDILFVTALLAILGFSVNDTIVIFDRIREQLNDNKENNILEPFGVIVGRSLTQTMARSINTSLTVFIALAVLLVLGGEATYTFILALAIGVVAGSYSSIFLASPLLVYIASWQKKK